MLVYQRVIINSWACQTHPLSTNSPLPLPETDSNGGAAAGKALWKHMRADSLASQWSHGGFF